MCLVITVYLSVSLVVALTVFNILVSLYTQKTNLESVRVTRVGLKPIFIITNDTVNESLETIRMREKHLRDLEIKINILFSMEPWLKFNITFIFTKPSFICICPKISHYTNRLKHSKQSNQSRIYDIRYNKHNINSFTNFVDILRICDTFKLNVPSLNSTYHFTVPIIFSDTLLIMNTKHLAGISIPQLNCIILGNALLDTSEVILAHELAHFFWSVHLKHLESDIECLTNFMNTSNVHTIMYPFEPKHVGKSKNTKYTWASECYDMNRMNVKFLTHHLRRLIIRTLKKKFNSIIKWDALENLCVYNYI